MKLIIGLGNPGEKYKNTRHNLGFRVVDEFRNRNKDLGLSWKMVEKFSSQIIVFNYFLVPRSYQLVLVKPQTYMNNSGQAVKKILDYYKRPVEDLVVIHDDLDLPLGRIQIKQGGGAAGHHGVESVIEAIGDRFIRIRLGIGPATYDSERFVVEEFDSSEKEKVEGVVNKAVSALKLLLDEGFEVAQNQYN
ncbi:MAG: aminoacyl-tRNA hydrolase [Armatimonadetes bacterium]|nr:MAG: aminoacyl-tRNA hydrolase [Armatimonadota bacterium]